MIIDIKTQTGIFKELGGHIVCEIETVGSPELSGWHNARKLKWTELLIELRKSATWLKFPIRNIPPKILRALLYKYFPGDVEHDLDWKYELPFQDYAFNVVKRAEVLARYVNNWLNENESEVK
jgi:hypothetical protein